LKLPPNLSQIFENPNKYIKNRYLLLRIQNKTKQKFTKRIQKINHIIFNTTKLYNDLIKIILNYIK